VRAVQVSALRFGGRGRPFSSSLTAALYRSRRGHETCRGVRGLPQTLAGLLLAARRWYLSVTVVGKVCRGHGARLLGGTFNQQR